MASWNSVPLEFTYQVLGWTAFLSWAMCFYPQVISNFCRKSVVGMSFDFVVLNLTKHSFYLIYNASLFFSPIFSCHGPCVSTHEKYGYGEMIPVAANDVALSSHTVLMTALLLFQIVIYERGSQKVSKLAIAIVSAVWLFAAACFFVALPRHSWLWLISIFKRVDKFLADGCAVYRSRFFGELLWKQREGVVVSGIYRILFTSMIYFPSYFN